jgi:AcrR family transcriptional regulator
MILEVARDEFAQRGFDNATVRQIAGRAGVDPGMIAHHFGSKQQLFLAALEVPFDPATEIAQVVDGPREDLAARLLSRFLEVWDSPAGAGAIAVVRTAVQRDDSAALIRDLALHRALRPLMATLDGTTEERLWRANLAASQIVGLIFTRYVVRLEPLASAAHAEVVAAVAPTVQRYLTGPLARA